MDLLHCSSPNASHTDLLYCFLFLLQGNTWKAVCHVFYPWCPWVQSGAQWPPLERLTCGEKLGTVESPNESGSSYPLSNGHILVEEPGAVCS